MSVRIAETQEIAESYGQWRGLGVHIRRDGPTDTVLLRTLIAAHFAQIAAYSMAYLDSLVSDPVQGDPRIAQKLLAQKPAFMPGSAQIRELVRTWRGLLYNTITNEGHDFLPREDRENLEWAIRVLVDFLAGL